MRIKFLLAAIAALLLTAGSASAATREITVTGTFLIAHADGRNGVRDANFYLLKTSTGYFDLHLSKTPELKPNQGVVVTGAEQGRQLFVSAIKATAPAPAVAAAQAAQTLSALVILVSWPSAPPDGVTPAYAEAQVGSTDDTWYQEVSYGRLGMSATATPWLTIPDPGGDCPLGEIWTSAEAAAAASGYNPAAYDREMFYVPWAAGICPGFAGFGLVGGSTTWILGEMDTRVTVHELGHNLGLLHSHSLRCSDASGPVPFSATCDPFDEYGDPFDAMGGGFFGSGHFNAVQKNRLGWVAGEVRDLTLPIRGRVRVTLTPLELAGGLKALAIHADGTTFWVEYRTATGVDAWLSSTFPGALNGVLFHTPQPSDGSNGTNLLDMTPGSDTGIFDFWDAALPVGASYTDPSRSFILTVRSASATGSDLVVRRPVGKK